MERKNWEELLRNFFEYLLEVLKNDPFRSVGSSVDDLRSWLADYSLGELREKNELGGGPQHGASDDSCGRGTVARTDIIRHLQEGSGCCVTHLIQQALAIVFRLM